jgi:hypothetical protein
MPTTLTYVDLSGNRLMFGAYLQDLKYLTNLTTIIMNGHRDAYQVPTNSSVWGGWVGVVGIWGSIVPRLWSLLHDEQALLTSYSRPAALKDKCLLHGIIHFAGQVFY